MYETPVTVVGNLVTNVDWNRFDDGTTVANFRVGSTERRYDRATGGWKDGEKLYVDVRCWRRLAENAAASLVKGDSVVVTGKLYTRSYEHEGQRRSAMTVDAHSIGADLARCTVVVKRERRGPDAGAVGSEPVTEAPGDVDGPAALVGAAPGGEG